MTARCYRCGRIKPKSKSVERRLAAMDIGGGWWSAGQDYSDPDGAPILGTDPATICPRCEHLRDEAEAALEEDVRSVAQDFRDSIKDALAEETLAEEAERN